MDVPCHPVDSLQKPASQMLHPAILSFLDEFQLGHPRRAQNLTVVPIFARGRDEPEYLTSQEALADPGFRVTEVSEGGSVPNLRVVNGTRSHVLLVDGEELAGAKQNRVMNTSILVAAGTDLIVPVSCTERGRWSYQNGAPDFAPSEVVLSPRLRRFKSASVSHSLDCSASFTSDQGGVWDSIEEMHEALETSEAAGTRAYRDAFRARESELRAFAADLAPEPDQFGLLVLIDGRVAGLDVVSRAVAYRGLHDRLVRSAAMDAMAAEQARERKAELRRRLRRQLEALGEPLPAWEPGEREGADPASDAPGAVLRACQAFLRQARCAHGEGHKSPGLGTDHRIRSESIMGSSLVVDRAAVHLALFPTMGEGDGEDDGTGIRLRRRTLSRIPPRRRRRHRMTPREERGWDIVI